MRVDDCPIATFHDGARGAATHIRLAATAHARGAAGELISRMYGWRGYACDIGDSAAQRVVFVAECGGAPVGTMSLCLDRSSLPADEHFGVQLAQWRRQGRRLAEPSRLAIDRGMSKRVFAALIHVSYVVAHLLHRSTDYVIEVNPRHVVFYQQMLGFIASGQPIDCRRVGAPAVLLRLALADMGARIARSGGLGHEATGERSFYPYFFAPHEEADIVARLCGNRELAA